MKKSCLIIFILYSVIANAQYVHASKTYINTCYHNATCFSLSSNSFIFYNAANNELILTVDFSKFKIGNDTLDEWLDDLDDTKLVFKGYLDKDNLLSPTHHNHKTIVVNGLMNFNGISHSYSFAITLFEISKDGMLFVDNQTNYFDQISMNLQFGFYPKEFKINKKAHHLKKKITIAIYKGVINSFNPGMEHLIIEK